MNSKPLRSSDGKVVRPMGPVKIVAWQFWIARYVGSKIEVHEHKDRGLGTARERERERERRERERGRREREREREKTDSVALQ